MTELSLPEESIFAQALEITSAAERAAFLDRAWSAHDARASSCVADEIGQILFATSRSFVVLRSKPVKDPLGRFCAAKTQSRRTNERTFTSLPPAAMFEHVPSPLCTTGPRWNAN